MEQVGAALLVLKAYCQAIVSGDERIASGIQICMITPTIFIIPDTNKIAVATSIKRFHSLHVTHSL